MKLVKAPESMEYKEFVLRVLKDCDDLCCPFDGICCERSSCFDCPNMKREYEERWGK